MSFPAFPNIVLSDKSPVIVSFPIVPVMFSIFLILSFAALAPPTVTVAYPSFALTAFDVSRFTVILVEPFVL